MAQAGRCASQAAKDRQRYLGRFRRHGTDTAHDAAIGRARSRGLSRHTTGSIRRDHHCQFYPDGSRTCARGRHDRKLEELHRSCPKLAAPDRAHVGVAGVSRQAAFAAAGTAPRRGQVVRHGSWIGKAPCRRCQLSSEGRQRARHRRRQRLGKILVGARPGWRMAAVTRRYPARRRIARAMVA